MQALRLRVGDDDLLDGNGGIVHVALSDVGVADIDAGLRGLVLYLNQLISERDRVNVHGEYNYQDNSNECNDMRPPPSPEMVFHSSPEAGL